MGPSHLTLVVASTLDDVLEAYGNGVGLALPDVVREDFAEEENEKYLERRQAPGPATDLFIDMVKQTNSLLFSQGQAMEEDD